MVYNMFFLLIRALGCVLNLLGQKKKYVCLRSPDPTLIFASDPMNFYTEFG